MNCNPIANVFDSNDDTGDNPWKVIQEQLCGLEKLDYSSCQLKPVPNWIQYLTDLKKLNLKRNSLKKHHPWWLHLMYSIKTLKCDNGVGFRESTVEARPTHQLQLEDMNQK